MTFNNKIRLRGSASFYQLFATTILKINVSEMAPLLEVRYVMVGGYDQSLGLGSNSWKLTKNI